ncbi:MAG: hypothetical protein KZQ99_07430 [Candidatus Thiodiazotropha sp. (ex Dulcina madagascariensis)]|nr:hypothetical protein [Candidatus Thiodiazotropha sp. (ex Dulcina madagascariensis)]
MNHENQPVEQPKDDFDLALAAMKRAADTARKRALLRDGKLVAWRDGRMVKEWVSDDPYRTE